MDITADTLLAIPLDAPSQVFPQDPIEAAHVWRSLARQWHPDRTSDPRAEAVFAHLNALRKRASDWRSEGRWEANNTLTLRGTDGKTRRLRYLKRHATDLGETLIARTIFTSLTRVTHADLAERERRAIANLTFANAKMADEMQMWLPSEIARFETPAHHALVLTKAPDMVLLADLLAHHDGTLDARHVGWIVSGMLHVACYLEWAGLAHHAIGPETWLVSPEQHSGALLGGWAFATDIGTRLRAAPARTVNAAPSIWKTTKIATGAMDRELIKLTGREMGHDMPDALTDWLTRPPMARAIDDYREWKNALRDAFGRPRFMKLTTTPDTVYGDAQPKET